MKEKGKLVIAIMFISLGVILFALFGGRLGEDSDAKPDAPAPTAPVQQGRDLVKNEPVVQNPVVSNPEREKKTAVIQIPFGDIYTSAMKTAAGLYKRLTQWMGSRQKAFVEEMNTLEILSRMVLSDAVSGKEIRIGDMAMGMTLDDVLNAVGLRIERGIDFGMYAGVAFAESYVHDVGITVMSSREERMDCLCDYLIMLVLRKSVRDLEADTKEANKYIKRREISSLMLPVEARGTRVPSIKRISTDAYAELVLLMFLKTAYITM